MLGHKRDVRMIIQQRCLVIGTTCSRVVIERAESKRLDETLPAREVDIQK